MDNPYIPDGISRPEDPSGMRNYLKRGLGIFQSPGQTWPYAYIYIAGELRMVFYIFKYLDKNLEKNISWHVQMSHFNVYV